MQQFEPGIHHIEFWVANLEESICSLPLAGNS
ncbi:hypothetical protein KOY_03272 [Bacillus cereus VDM021]|nr:hypothetical protein KOW_00600 [Bacillus cereus VDM006]EOQ09303.1 hypothetical protein KOY_03272 [Bacillus cereus VDM021]